MTMIVPCILCREPLPSVPLEHEKHLQSEHKVNFHKSLIIRKTLKERRRPTMYEKEAINDESDVINVTCLLCRESLPSLLHENEKHFQNVHKINFHLSWIIGKNLKEGRKSVSIMIEDLKKPNTILCDDFEQPVQIGEISKCLTENQNRKMKKFVPDDSIENERKQFSCDICGKLFETERSVRTHKRNHTSVNKTFFEDDLNILYDEETLQTKNFVTQNLHVKSQPRGPYDSDLKHITNNVSKEVKTKKEINWDIFKKGDKKNEELKEYSIKVSGGTRYVGPYGEVFIPEDCEEDSVNEEDYNCEDKGNNNVMEGMNIEEDERESLWKSFMSDLEDDNIEENVSKKDEPEEKNSQETHTKENKKNQLYDNMDGVEDENGVNIQTEKADCSAKSSARKEQKKYGSKMQSEDSKPIQDKDMEDDANKMLIHDKLSINKVKVKKEKVKNEVSDPEIRAKNKAMITKAHLRIMRGGKTYTCDVCTKGMSSKGNLKIHLKIHTGEKSYKCDACPKAFFQCIGLERHKKRHIGEKDFPCTQCTKALYENQSLRNHMVIHAGMNVEEGERDFLRKSLISDETEEDANTEENVSEKDKPKERISQEDHRKGSKKNHLYVTTKSKVKSTHSGKSKAYTCSVCQKSFKTKHYVETHEKNHGSEEKKSFSCNLCNKSFKTQWYVKTHQKNHSTA